MLHANSPRREAPMVSVNCASIPEHVLEEELFGYSKGSGPDRDRARSGRCQQAHGGSFCLELVEALPPAMQDRLTDTAQCGYFKRPAEERQIPVDLRFMATSEVSPGENGFERKISPAMREMLGANILPVPSPPGTPGRPSGLGRVFSILQRVKPEPARAGHNPGVHGCPGRPPLAGKPPGIEKPQGTVRHIGL